MKGHGSKTTIIRLKRIITHRSFLQESIATLDVPLTCFSSSRSRKTKFRVRSRLRERVTSTHELRREATEFEGGKIHVETKRLGIKEGQKHRRNKIIQSTAKVPYGCLVSSFL